MSNTSSAGAKQKNSSSMGSGASQVDPLRSKRGSSSVYSSTLSSLAKSVASSDSSTAQHGTASGGAARGVANTAGYQTRSRIAPVNDVRGHGPIKTSPRDDEFPNNTKKKDNLKFYSNEIASKPFPGTKIDDILRKWKGDYQKLEYDHQYIQWLFPLPEGKGLNSWAQPLQQHEAFEIQSDSHKKLRVLRAYRMMLDFYGIKLQSSITGELTRADNYIERFAHLNRSPHNYRRITRIIKSIGFLGYGNLQTPFVKFLINEACIQKTMPNVRGGSIHHWIEAIADEKEQEETMKMFLDVNHGVDFCDDYYNVDSADEAMEDMEANSYNVDTNQFNNVCNQFNNVCSLESTHTDAGNLDTNSGNAFSLGVSQRDTAPFSINSDLHGSVRDHSSWDRQSNMLESVSRTVSSNTYRDSDSSRRNSDSLYSRDQNSKPKLKDLASGRNFTDLTAPVSWDD